MENQVTYKDDLLGKFIVICFLLAFFLLFVPKQVHNELPVSSHSALWAQTQISPQAFLVVGFKIPQFNVKWTFGSDFEFLFAPALNLRNTFSNEFALTQFKVLVVQFINFKAAGSRKIFLDYHYIKVNPEHPLLS